MTFLGKVGNEQMIKLWWRDGLPSGYRDCFPDLSLLGDMEWYQPTALHDAAVLSIYYEASA